MTTWLLPDNIADVLPRQARTMESMRRTCLDLFQANGFELVQPPMIEFVDSLLTGTGTDLDRNTFKFMDQANGRMIGVRADITPQAARIDAHILNRSGISRLCYAGSCLHAKPMHPLASREPFVAGAELFGAADLEADIQMLRLAVKTLRQLGLSEVHLDLGHMGVVRALLDRQDLSDGVLADVLSALKHKDGTALDRVEGVSDEIRRALHVLLVNFGDASVLDALRRDLPADSAIERALDEIETVSRCAGADSVSFDFCDVHGYQYLTGLSFSVHIPQDAKAILRGGRYDNVGLAFGRSRPACGFSIYLRALAAVAELEVPAASIVITRGSYDPAIESIIDTLREQGKTVVRLLPGESVDALKEQFNITHELVRTQNSYELKALGC